MAVYNVRDMVRPGFTPGRDVYVGRPHPRVVNVEGADGYFGNEHRIDARTTREQAVRLFEETARQRIVEDPRYRDRVRALHGKDLWCWCVPALCHAEVLERLACELAGAEAMESEGP